MAESEDTCDNCGEIELVSGTFVSDSGDLITSGKFCTICEMFESTDNFIHDDFERQYANREELEKAIRESYLYRHLDERKAFMLFQIIRTHALKEE